jgi:hypothetical protein
MNDKFDELTRRMAQSVTRRQALKKFGLGLAGMALACLGLASKGQAQTGCLPDNYSCVQDSDCCSGRCRARQSTNPFNGRKYKVYVCVS